MAIISSAVSVASAGKSLWDTFGFGGSDNPPIEDPLPLNARELEAAMRANPRDAEQIRSYILNTVTCCSGADPATESGVRNTFSGLATQALYLANGAPGHSKGEGMTPKESHVRSQVVALMNKHASGQSAGYESAQVAGEEGPSWRQELGSFLDRIARTDELQERAEAAVSGAGAGASAGLESARVRQSTPAFLQGNAWPIALAVAGIAAASLFRR